MTKYKEYFIKMLDDHKELFDKFRPVHAKYALSPAEHQSEFNDIGEKVMEIIHEYEDRLCNKSESNGYASFTGKLAEKFMEEVRKEFELIDRVGLIISNPQPAIIAEEPFELNQIKVNRFNLKKIDL